jgi:hypothetical protein
MRKSAIIGGDIGERIRLPQFDALGEGFASYRIGNEGVLLIHQRGGYVA